MNNKSTNWKIVQTTKTGQEYIQSATLKEGPRSKTTAVFFRNKHKTSNDYIISLKVSHNAKDSNGWLSEKPEKTITLSNEQIDKLIEYIKENYMPLSLGEDSYITLSNDNLSSILKQVSALNLQPDDLVSRLYEAGILTDNLNVAIIAAERRKCIIEFESELSQNHPESFWQEWFSDKKWILGSDYLKILNERDIDESHIADYIMQSYDGFLDLVEIKKPDAKFWTGPDSHGNYNPSSDLVSAISQCLNYLYRVERKADSDDFRERVSGVRTVKPRCLLVFGKSSDWDEKKYEAFRILNAAYNQINIITYDQLLIRAKQLLGISLEDSEESFELDDLPF